jgi:large subunit ribosomal protein L19e
MNLGKKKALAVRTLKVGKARIVFLESRLNEIKEAITKQDIKDLKEDGAIIIKNINGRKTKIKKKSRSPGNIRKKVNKRKQEYVKATRKQRAYVGAMKKSEKVSLEEYKDIRKKIRNRIFKSKAHLREYIGGLKK